MEEKKIALLEREVSVQVQEPAKPTAPAPAQPIVSRRQPKRDSASVVEKPNYDFIESLPPEQAETVYRLEKTEKAASNNTFGKRLRVALFSLVLAVGGVWGIVNVVSITQVQSQLEAANALYELNLASYLTKLATLDSASSYDELFETYPNQPQPPTEIAPSSNWFDRFCNFIAGLFGG